MKKVIIEVPKIEVVGIDNIESHNIYAFVYKDEVFMLHNLNPFYGFLSVFNTRSSYGGSKASMKSAIINVMDSVDVFEFTGPSEFLTWALSQSKC